MRAQVVVAEDDPKQAELVRRYVEREGYDVVVVPDGRAALDEVRRRTTDLLVLDVMMPRVDGFDVCRVIRSTPDLRSLPILMLTARAAEDDLLLGLDLGADDFLTKPYSPRELVARIRTLLRRTSGAEAPDPVLRVGPLAIDAARHVVTVDDRAVDVTPGEFELLAMLAAEPDRVFTRAQLIGRLHGVDAYITFRTVDVHVMNLRRKIEADPRRPALLVTVYGVGYKLASAGPVVAR